MNKVKKLSLLMLITASCSLHTFTTPETFVEEDDMTSFDDLASAGHHLRAKIQEEGDHAHESYVSDLVNDYYLQHKIYEHIASIHDSRLREKLRLEWGQEHNINKIRSSWQWRDYTVATALAGTLAVTTATAYESLDRLQSPLVLGCATIATGAYFLACGCGADWADNARCNAADELKKEYEAGNQKLEKEFQNLTEIKKRAGEQLKKAYKTLLAAKPRTAKAAALGEGERVPLLPRELRS